MDSSCNEQLALPPTKEERQQDRSALDHLHVANRFRLMFGQPFLEDDPGVELYKKAMKAVDR